MVAAENNRCLVRARRIRDQCRDAIAQRDDLRQEARVLVAHRSRLRNRCFDVAVVVCANPELCLEMLGELGVSNRRRAHVDAAPAGPEIERRADEDDVPLGRLRAHGSKANVRALGNHQDAVDAASGAAAPVRVLLADDDGLFLESLRPLIEHQPELTVVGTAENGLHAIELADELDPDAVVIDLHMPLVDGVTAVARLRKDHPSICLIALTGDPDRELHEAVAEAGADAVLQKGELVETLVERLSAVRSASTSA
jgi:CheY-like chemotaxis protein